jgi:hypothetical protein
VQSPSDESLASTSVARLAARGPEKGAGGCVVRRAMGPQVGSPEIGIVPEPRGWRAFQAAVLDGGKASRGQPGGIADCGNLEEDTPGTWEAPSVRRRNTAEGRKRRGKTEVTTDKDGESDTRIVATRTGNLGTGPGRAKARQCRQGRQRET